MPLPSSPILPHGQHMATITLGTGEIVVSEISTSPTRVETSPGAGHGPQREGDRPANQQQWTDADLYTLRRDREQAQAVRDMYMLSNPGEFPNIFTDDEEGEERITPSNYLNGRAQADRELYDDSNQGQEVVRDSRWHAEVV